LDLNSLFTDDSNKRGWEKNFALIVNLQTRSTTIPITIDESLIRGRVIETRIEGGVETALLCGNELQQNDAETLGLDHPLFGEHSDFPLQVGSEFIVRRRVCLVYELQSLVHRVSQSTRFEVHFVTRFY
jgi:hypothetical protein